MPLKVRRLPQAVEDLHEIWLNIAVDNERAANRQVERFYAAEDLIADFPEVGEARPDLGPGFRKWTVGSYVMVYKVETKTIAIIRILHGARDRSANFDD